MKIPGLNYTSPRAHAPSAFTVKERAVLAVAPPAAALCMRVAFGLCRKEMRNSARWDQALKEHEHVIIAIWHEAMALGSWHFRNTGCHTMTSYSFDGEMAARIIRHFGQYAVRGSSSRGGSEALTELGKALDHVETVGLTLDGPHGPRRVAKPGAAILAARKQVPIVPVALTVHPAWRLNSWDRFPIPKPFATILGIYGEPIPPPPDCSQEAIETTRARTEAALNDLHNRADAELAATG